MSFIKIDGILGIITITVAGAIIFALGLVLLRALSSQDRKLIKEIITGLKF